jgi:nuclear receptor subfamily 1 group F member 4
LSQAVLRALRMELDRNHRLPLKGDVLVGDTLLGKMPELRYDSIADFYFDGFCANDFAIFRELNMLHMEALAKFKRSTPHLEFPALHKELFSVDS